MIGPRTFTFNGVTSDTYFLIRDIQRPPLPPIHVESITVPRRAGAYPVASTLGVREITVGVWLLKENWTDLRTATRNIAAWLYTEDDKMLTFSDEPDKYYLARVQGEISYTEQLYYWEGEISFLCLDPFAYATVEKKQFIRNQNLLPYYDFADLTKWTNWYNNLTFESYTFASGRKGMMVTMADVVTNPRMRVVSSPENRAQIVEGKTYTISFIFQHSSTLEKVDLAGVYYYADHPSPMGWVTLPTVTTASLPIESTQDNTKIYQHTFVAQQTAGVRIAIGFGLGNPLIQNGSWFRIKQAKIEEAPAMTYDENKATVQNLGTAKTFPRFRVTPTKSGLTYFKLMKGTEAILINQAFAINDTFIIDCESNLVYDESSGARMMNLVDISTDFFSLEVGDNAITTSPVDGFNVEAYWRDRWI